MLVSGPTKVAIGDIVSLDSKDIVEQSAINQHHRFGVNYRGVPASRLLPQSSSSVESTCWASCPLYISEIIKGKILLCIPYHWIYNEM